MPGADRDEDSGTYTTTYDDDEFLAVIEANDLPTTPDIAEAVGCNRRTAYVRLNDLEDRGIVTSREVGRTLVWTLAE